MVDQPRCRSHRPPPTTNQPDWLLSGERIHAEITANAWRFLAFDVPYDRRTILFGGPLGFACAGLASMFGNRRARRRAEAVAAPQWRYLGHLPVIVTDRRLLIQHDGAWWPILGSAIRSAYVEAGSLTLLFKNDPPYALCCADADGLRSVLVALDPHSRSE